MLLIAMLVGCTGRNLPASVGDGVCNIVPRAEYEILGKTRNDQKWIDETIEGEVGGCGFARPQPRPAAWDAKTAPSATVAPVAAKKRPGLLKRTIGKAKKVFQRRPPPQAAAPVTRDTAVTVAPIIAAPPTTPTTAAPPLETTGPPAFLNVRPQPPVVTATPVAAPKKRDIVDELLDD